MGIDIDVARKLADRWIEIGENGLKNDQSGQAVGISSGLTLAARELNGLYDVVAEAES